MRLQHFFAPDKSTVLSLACTPQNLYAGLVSGAVAVYTKAEGQCPVGIWGGGLALWMVPLVPHVLRHM